MSYERYRATFVVIIIMMRMIHKMKGKLKKNYVKPPTRHKKKHFLYSSYEKPFSHDQGLLPKYLVFVRRDQKPF